MKSIRLWAEIPAGLAAVTLYLLGGKNCRPPVSRMGSKAGYAAAIADCCGLRPGIPIESILLCEADPDVRALLCAYTQPDLLRAVAEVLRGWKDEEPRALWTRLRDERRARKAALPADQAVAEWMFLHAGSFQFKGPQAGIGSPEGHDRGGWGVKPVLDVVPNAALRLATGPGWPPVAVTAAAPSAEEVAGWLAMQGMQHPAGGFAASKVEPQFDGANGPGRLNRSPWTSGKAASAMGGAVTAWPPTCITSGAPTAEEVAGWLTLCAWTRGNRTIGSYMGPDRPSACHPPGWTACITGEGIAKRADALATQHERPDSAGPWPPTCITSRAPTAEEVAGWLYTTATGHPGGGGFTGEFRALGPTQQQHMGPTTCRKYAEAYGVDARGWPLAPQGCSRGEVAAAVDRLAEVSSRPTEPTPGVDLEGCIIYMDPPYVGTTGYGADLPRAEVVRLATSYAAAGALVVVSEAVAIPELTALGWEAVDIAGERRGQKRTFSREQGEWLTMSRPPVNRPRIQVGLFG